MMWKSIKNFVNWLMLTNRTPADSAAMNAYNLPQSLPPSGAPKTQKSTKPRRMGSPGKAKANKHPATSNSKTKGSVVAKRKRRTNPDASV